MQHRSNAFCLTWPSQTFVLRFGKHSWIQDPWKLPAGWWSLPRRSQDLLRRRACNLCSNRFALQAWGSILTSIPLAGLFFLETAQDSTYVLSYCIWYDIYIYTYIHRYRSYNHYYIIIPLRILVCSHLSSYVLDQWCCRMPHMGQKIKTFCRPPYAFWQSIFDLNESTVLMTGKLSEFAHQLPEFAGRNPDSCW